MTGERRWQALVFLALAQWMVALDATIVNIALPSVQRAMHFSDAQRAWLVSAYTLSFAGLLLLGGRVADALGRRRALLVGLGGFAGASALAGAAGSFEWLVSARALQGAFAALLSPSALALLAATFTDPRERGKAFGVYGGIAGSGGAMGLLLGGVLTQSAGWRSCLYVNLPIALVAAAGVRWAVVEAPPAGRQRLDVVGAALATVGLGALVYACGEVRSGGHAAPLAVAALALGLFAAQQARSEAPLLPLRVVRGRAGAYLVAALALVGMVGVFLTLTYYFQVVLGYSPVRAGLSFLPMTASSLLGASLLAGRLLRRAGPRALLVAGPLTAALGMALLTRVGVESRFWVDLLPAELLVGLGIGTTMVTALSVATQGVNPRETGIASAAINAAQQVGGSIGAALLNAVAASATAAFAASQAAAPRAQALVHGYAVAAAWAAGALVAAAAVAAVAGPPRASA